MKESFDLYDYLNHLRARWRFSVVACVVAVSLAFIVSLVLQKQYTATARIIIEPPAASDTRAAMAVSPIYLESLRTFEHFALSDTLFLLALERFKLREQQRGEPVESLKRRILRVDIPRNTKILEISVRLPDPVKAHAVATYIAEESVKLNRSVNLETDQEMTAEAEKHLRDVRSQIEQAEAEWSSLYQREPIKQSSAGVKQLDTLSQLRREILTLERQAGGDSEVTRNRLARLRRELSELDTDPAADRPALSNAAARRMLLNDRRRALQDSVQAAENRLRDLRGIAGFRGERLRLLDPGIVPERPSFPNVPLNVVSALLFGFVVSLLYLTIEFAIDRRRPDSAPRPLRVAGRDV